MAFRNVDFLEPDNRGKTTKSKTVAAIFKGAVSKLSNDFPKSVPAVAILRQGGEDVDYIFAITIDPRPTHPLTSVQPE
jgi:hypothetical protein